MLLKVVDKPTTIPPSCSTSAAVSVCDGTVWARHGRDCWTGPGRASCTMESDAGWNSTIGFTA
eukprot:1087857-Rhodomonas_salina.2